MRLLLLSPRYPPAICGVGDHTAGLRRYLQDRGHSVLVATGTPEAAGQEGVQVYPADEKARGAWLLALVRKQGITHLLWQYSPYALHPQGMPGWVVGAMRMLRQAGVRQSVYFHEVRIRYSEPGLINKWRAWRQQRIAWQIRSICQGAATSILFYLPYLAHKGRPSVSLIPVPSNIPVTPQAWPGGATTMPRLVLFANRAATGVLQAIAAWQKQMALETEVCLLGVVDAVRSHRLWALGGELGLRISLSGPMPADALGRALAAADLILLPQPLDEKGRGGISLKNGTLAAALSTGRPVLATRGDMTGNDLTHGVHLHLLDDNRPATWEAALGLAWRDEGYRKRLGEAGLRFYGERLSWEVVGKGFERLLFEHR